MTGITAHLSDIRISTVVPIVIGLTVARVFLVKWRSPFGRAVLEIVDAVLFAIVLMFLIVLPFVVKSFYIPSSSMRETLIEDDHIMVNKFLYRVHPPEHGDVVVFTAPPEALASGGEKPEPDGSPTFYIKRLIGLPGDTIEVHAGLVRVGAARSALSETHGDVRSALGILDKDRQHIKFFSDHIEIFNSTRGAWSKMSKKDLAAKLGFPGRPIAISPGYVVRNGIRLSETYIAEDPDYDLKIYHGRMLTRDERGIHLNAYDFDGGIRGFDDMQSQPIPKDKVVVFGDNRNDSNDSSVWGPLNESRLVGKAFTIFYPLSRIRTIH